MGKYEKLLMSLLGEVRKLIELTWGGTKIYLPEWQIFGQEHAFFIVQFQLLTKCEKENLLRSLGIGSGVRKFIELTREMYTSWHSRQKIFLI